MERIFNSYSFKLFTFFVFTFFALANFSIAQEENVFLPTAPGTSDIGEESNIYLQRDSQPTQTAEQTTSSNAPTSNNPLSCPYKFTRNMELGMTGEDVRLLQVVLNSYEATIIARSGAGSPGRETGSYGESTKAAVAKLQESTREYVGTVNGRVGPRTLVVLNQLCSTELSRTPGKNVSKIQSVQNQNTEEPVATDKTAPRVSLSANFNSVQSGNTFKIIVNLSEPIKAFTPDFVIVDNGEVKEIRKLSKNSYAMSVIANEGAKIVNVQIEAEKIEDMAGNLNENASNEVVVKILAPVNTAQPNPTPNPTEDVDSLINKITSSVPDCRYNDKGDLITTNPITGQKLNANGCKLKDPSKQYAAFNTTLKCYADSGELPPGIQEVQRCSNPQNPNSPNNPLNPNNPNSPCSPFNQQQYAYQVQQAQRQSTYGGFSFGSVLPPNPCQNAQVVQATQQRLQQQRQEAQQAQQQQAQFAGLGQMLGNLLKGGAFGGGGAGANNRDGGNGEPAPRYQPPADEKTCDPNSELPWNKCPEKKETETTKTADQKCHEPDKTGPNGGIIPGKEIPCIKIPDTDPCKEGSGIISVGCGLTKSKALTNKKGGGGKIDFSPDVVNCVSVVTKEGTYSIFNRKRFFNPEKLDPVSKNYVIGLYRIDNKKTENDGAILIEKESLVGENTDSDWDSLYNDTKGAYCFVAEKIEPVDTKYRCVKWAALVTDGVSYNRKISEAKGVGIVECSANK